MKRILIIAAAILIGTTAASGQLYRTAYFMEGSTMRGAMNPAFRPYRGYVNIPVLGNITLNMTSDIAVNSLLFPMPDGTLVPFWDGNVTWDVLSKKLGDTNGMDVDVRTSIIGFGFYIGRGFLTFDLGARAEAGFNLPKGLFEFMKVGGGNHNLSGLSLGATGYVNASVGYSYKIFQNLTVGARINVLGGLARANMHYDKLDVVMTGDIWSVEAEGHLDVGINGFELPDMTDDPGYLDFSQIGDGFKNIKGLAGAGVTFDLGAEYKLLDRINFSFSVLDMGFMRWGANSATQGVSASKYTYEGASLGDNSDIGEEANNALADFTRFERQESKGFNSSIHATFLLGAEIDVLGNNILGIGLTYMNKKTEFVRKSEFSVIATVRPASWVTLAASYAFKNYKDVGGSGFNTLGAAINFHAPGINFFLGTDYMFSKINSMFVPIDMKMFNLYMGIAIGIGKDKKTNLPKLGI